MKKKKLHPGYSFLDIHLKPFSSNIDKIVLTILVNINFSPYALRVYNFKSMTR